MEKLGIQPIPLLLQVINFLLLLLLLKKFLYAPILQMLKDRRKKIEEGLEFGEKMKVEFDKSEKKRSEIVNKGKIEAQKIVEEARKTAKKKEEELIDKAEKEAAEIIERAEKELAVMKEKLEKDIHGKAIEVAQRLVEKLIKDALSETAQKAIIDKKIKEVTNQLK
ncbi:ATP synthase F0 subunit B [Candidatus Gottesmanbacteria bacterium RBG_16_37_8]|uniref:ATP synthase subunit b n=1 Tax=Candidatus Gottesmanbacteria bacterium RBG_16_37_8 TaxID=1798371 RepID=A0A1F5YWX5_9BACT|nr:MAG: ATP synthase F0 subunit B [Candidatus Gottesmanbacteria bacterium RBG_16_37_8]